MLKCSTWAWPSTHQRQLATEEGDAQGLQQRRQATGEQRRGNQQADIASAEACGLADDQRYGDHAAVQGQYMLQAIGQVGAHAEVLVFRTT